jgi:acetyl esterase
MALNPVIAGWLDFMNSMPAINTMPVAEARATLDAGRALQPPPPSVGHVANRDVPSPDGPIPVRIYTPFGIGPFPLVVHFHGGGFVIGDLESHDAACRHLCLASGAVVVAVHYRLAPEHKAPAAVEDCLAVTRWAAAHAGEIGADPRRVAVAGDSAGGSLSTLISMRIRDEGGPKLCAQLLNCPWVDMDLTRPSYRENKEGYFLSLSMIQWFFDQYMRSPQDRDDPRIVPMKAKDLKGLPPAYVLTAEYDPLRDEGEAYADRLMAAGVPVVKKRVSGMIHDFPCLSLNVIPEAAEELAAMGAWLKARFAAV